MKIAYFDCFSGVSGDMILGALLACGASELILRERLAMLGVDGWALNTSFITRNGIGATDVTITLKGKSQGHGRHLHHIEEILDSSNIPDAVRKMACRIFRRLADAEAKVHQTTPEKIHFHEVGAVDAIVDIVGSCLALELLGIEKVICSPLPMGHGFVKCAHGVIPIPAPAVLELTRNYPVVSADVEGEMVTPTGAAIMTTLSDGFGAMPAMTLQSVGYGAGKSDFGERPNLLRVMIGDSDESASVTDVAVLEVNLDDFSPQFNEYLYERLFEAGAIDVYQTPVLMKKGRPASLITVLAPPQSRDMLSEILLTETTTLGVRYSIMKRNCLDRKWVSVETMYGTIRMKIGLLDGHEVNAQPEYEDVRSAAIQCKIPIKLVHREALNAYEKQIIQTGNSVRD